MKRLLHLGIALYATTTMASSPIPNENKRIYVINNGWHTGLVIPAEPLQSQFPELKERFGDTPYLEIGWGDKGFYQAKDITFGITLNAILGLSGSIIHAVAIRDDPEKHFDKNSSKAICIQPQQLKTLSDIIAASFMQTADRRLIPMQKGLYGDSQFYDAVGAYYIFNTCNSWTASSLKNAGFDINANLKLSADSVMREIENLSTECPE